MDDIINFGEQTVRTTESGDIIYSTHDPMGDSDDGIASHEHNYGADIVPQSSNDGLNIAVTESNNHGSSSAVPRSNTNGPSTAGCTLRQFTRNSTSNSRRRTETEKSKTLKQLTLSFDKKESRPAEVALFSLREKPKKSWVWEHFVNKDKIHHKATCKYCELEVYGSNTTNYMTHLKNNHTAIMDPKVQESSVSSTSDRTDLEPEGGEKKQRPETRPPQRKRRRAAIAVKHRQQKLTSASFLTKSKYVLPYPLHSKRKKILDMKLLFMIVRDFQPFSIVEDQGFLDFVAELDPRYKPPSRRTIVRSLLPEAHALVLEKLKSILQNVEHVGITFDGWTSRSKQSYLGVTGHFQVDGIMYGTMLKLIHTSDIAHSGVKLCEFIKTEVYKEYEIHAEYAVTDAGSNMIKTVEELKVPYSIVCFAHRLQRVVHTAIVKTSVEECAKINWEDRDEDVEKALEKLMDNDEVPVRTSAMSLIKKCKKITRFFNTSTKAMAQLRKELEKRPNCNIQNVIQEVSTRWNSTFLMLERISAIIDEINIVLLRVKHNVEFLNRDEIAALPRVVNVLRPIYEATICLSSTNFVSVSQIIPTVKGMKLIIRALKEEADSQSRIATDLADSLLASFTKLDDYEKNTLARVATLLDPRFKAKGFQKEEFVQAGRMDLQRMIKAMLQKRQPLPTAGTSQTTEPTNNAKLPSFYSYLQVQDRRESGQQKQQYFAGDIIPSIRMYMEQELKDMSCDPLKYWHSVDDSSLLKPVAQSVLVCPATSVPSESAFSAAGYTLMERRTRFLPRNLASVLFLNRNYYLLG